MVLLHATHCRARLTSPTLCLVEGAVTELGSYFGLRVGVPALKSRVNLAACLARDILVRHILFGGPWVHPRHLLWMIVLLVARALEVAVNG
jgi:hypothetical protein